MNSKYIWKPDEIEIEAPGNTNPVVHKYVSGDTKSIFGKPYTYDGSKWIPDEGYKKPSKKDVEFIHELLQKKGLEHITDLSSDQLRALLKKHGLYDKKLSPKDKLEALKKIYLGDKQQEKKEEKTPEPPKTVEPEKPKELPKEKAAPKMQGSKPNKGDISNAKDYLMDVGVKGLPNLHSSVVRALLKKHDLWGKTKEEKLEGLKKIYGTGNKNNYDGINEKKEEELHSSGKPKGFEHLDFPNVAPHDNAFRPKDPRKFPFKGNLHDPVDKVYNDLANKLLPHITNGQFKACHNYIYNCWGINNLLRGKVKPEAVHYYDKDKFSIDNLHKLFEEVKPMGVPMKLFRGTGLPKNAIAKLYEPGAVFSDKAFLSTSTNREKANSFGKLEDGFEKVLFEISTPAHCKGLPISDWPEGGYSSEREILLNSSSKLKVVSAKNEGGTHVVKVEWVGEKKNKPVLPEKAS